MTHEKISNEFSDSIPVRRRTWPLKSEPDEWPIQQCVCEDTRPFADDQETGKVSEEHPYTDTSEKGFEAN